MRVGHYELHEQLGSGGMGIVYHAHDTLMHRDVAIKLVRLDHAKNTPDAKELDQRLLREARAASLLKHPQRYCYSPRRH